MTGAAPLMSAVARVLRSPVKYVLIGFLYAYRLVISPLYGNVCRYWPSCSAYALQAVQMHGAAKGSWLAVRRLARCHPWASGGYDPVPGTDDANMGGAAGKPNHRRHDHGKTDHSGPVHAAATETGTVAARRQDRG
jgi:putative membrane protein insertion efficiency factor